jgi:hypothetical protein
MGARGGVGDMLVYGVGGDGWVVDGGAADG